MGKDIIISRHPGAIKWLKEKLEEDCEVKEHFTSEDISELTGGDKVYGILPIPLVSEVLKKGADFYLISLPVVAFSERGNELTPEGMEKAGAKIMRVKTLTLEG